MSYKDLLDAYIQTTNAVLGEEKARLLFMYLRRKGYNHKTNGITSDLIEKVEFTKEEGFADLEIVLSNNEVSLKEYNSKRELVSVTNFSTLERFDIIRNNGQKRYVISTKNFSVSRYFNNLDTLYILMLLNGHSIPEDHIEDDSKIIEDDDLLFRLIEIEDYVSDIKINLEKGIEKQL